MTAPTRSPATRDEPVRSTAINGIQPKPQDNIEVGVSAHLPWQTPYKDAWEALRTDDVTVRQLVTMRRTDGQARALYRLITLPIRAALKTATFVPEEGTDGGEDEAAFIQDMFTLPVTGGGMAIPFGRIIAQMLMAVFDGFAAFEMVYWQPEDGPLKDKWTLKKMAHRPSEQLTFLLNDNSEFVGLRQQTMYHDRQIDVVIDADNVCYYAANEEERPFYGLSYFNAAYRHWEAKFKLYVVAHIAAQRAAVGTRVGTMPPAPSRDEKAAFQRSLADLGIAQWMTIPADYKVESLKEFTGFDFLGYINHHNSQMSKSILAAFFDDSQGSGGDASLVDFGRQSDGLFLLMLQTIMGEIEEVINTQVIPKFIDWNFDSKKYPKFVFGTMTEEQKGALLDLFKSLAAAGESMTVAPEMFREMEIQVSEHFGLEVDWEAVVEREEEEARQAELAAQMAMQAGMDPEAGPGGAPPAGGPGGGPAGGPGGGPAGGPAPTPPAGPHGAQINPSNVPEGFALSAPADPAVTLTDMAASLLDDALLNLTRGRPNSGGPKYVRSSEGARTYGVPIGTPITRDMEKALAEHGVKGKKYGYNHQKNDNKKVRHIPGQGTKTEGGGTGAKPTDASSTLGGGKGAKPQNPGSVEADPTAPKKTFSNPDEPGAQLLDYGDGTVAIRDANGVLTPRQRFDISRFTKLGWHVENAQTADKPDDKAAKK